jgi:hypothetical protein
LPAVGSYRKSKGSIRLTRIDPALDELGDIPGFGGPVLAERVEQSVLSVSEPVNRSLVSEGRLRQSAL